MKLAKTLEAIGQNTSLKEFSSLEELLTEAELKPEILTEIITTSSNLICGQFPERDDPDKEDDDGKEDEEEKRKAN